MSIVNESRFESKVESELKRHGIKYAYNSINDINGQNLIIDTSNVNDTNIIQRLIKFTDKLKSYNSKIINIPVDDWFKKSNGTVGISNTPLDAVYRYIKQTPIDFKKSFAGYIFLFYNNTGESLPLFVDQYRGSEFDLFDRQLNTLLTSHAIKNINNLDQLKSPVKFITGTNEDDAKSELKEKKDNLVKAIAKVVEDSEDEEEAMEAIYSDEEIQEMIDELDEDDGKPKFDSARTSRMSKLNDEFLKKTVRGRTVKEILESKPKEIPAKHLEISSINEEWEEVKYPNFQKAYDLNEDIIKILNEFVHKDYPVSILDINIEDTSTNQDWLYTYSVEMEDAFGKRFTLKFDIPKFKNERFMRLGGNEKTLSAQLLLLPCIKVDENLVKCVSNYNTIRIERVGQKGKSISTVARFLKTLNKMENDQLIKISYGNNTSICSKYELPIDYIDLAGSLNKIETPDYIYYFNQDILFSQFNANKKKGLPYAIDRKTGEIKYYIEKDGESISSVIIEEIQNCSEKFAEIFRHQKATGTMNYSSAHIMNSKIPLAVVIGNSIGLSKMLNLCNIKKKIIKKGESFDPSLSSIIKFNDGAIEYPLNYANSLLFNGLATCPTENYSLADIDSKVMWLDFLDDYGGRIISDGLDNFRELFIDPITAEVCDHCKLPSSYFEMLVYANNLLADNKYNRHTDISGNRFRTNEIVAGYFYKAITKAYAEYKAQVKRGRKVGISMKRSEVIDSIMMDPTSSDLSILNPLLEIETANSVSFKGLSGMNSDRSYGLDKRTYDDSMTNKLAMSTGFSANVGINRQTTIDMDIAGRRGYIKNTGKDDMSITKSFSMSEALTPFGTTRDDPFRSAMTFIQTSKHSMRTKRSMPLLITNGADEAMPYLSSDTFAYKAKDDGTVIEMTDDYMVIEYKKPIVKEDGQTYIKECIDLRNNVQKNSDGGFFITLKLDTELKVGSKFKQGEIIAYDKSSFSSSFGEDDNLSYNLGVLAKVAILNTDEGFEDSTAVSYWLSDAMATDVVVEKDIVLSKQTNVLDIVKVGQEIQEGDPLIMFQNAFEEKDANALLKSITDPEFVSDLGRIRLKSKYTGIIQDIKIYRTCEIEDMSESLSKIVINYEKKIKAQKALYKKYNMPGANVLEPDYKMEPTGKMKNVLDGVKIIFYISYNDKLSVGDKIVAQSANKGVIKNIFPEGLEPFTESHPNEKIHALFASRSFNARMVTSVWTAGLINKAIIELDRQVKDIMGIEWTKIEEP